MDLDSKETSFVNQIGLDDEVETRGCMRNKSFREPNELGTSPLKGAPVALSEPMIIFSILQIEKHDTGDTV